MTSLYSYYNTWCNILLLLLYNLHGVRLSYRMSTSRTVFSNRRLKRQPPFCWKEHHGFAFHITLLYFDGFSLFLLLHLADTVLCVVDV